MKNVFFKPVASILLLIGLMLPMHFAFATCICTNSANGCQQAYLPVLTQSDKACADTCKKILADKLTSSSFATDTAGDVLDQQCNDAQKTFKANQAAASSSTPPAAPKIASITPTLNVEIPGLTFSPAIVTAESVKSNFLADYLNAIYAYLIGAAVTIAIVMIMIGGLQYTLGAGSQNAGKGKDRIKNGITGLVLLLCVFLILKTTNPQLVLQKMVELQNVQDIPLPVEDFSQGYDGTPNTIDVPSDFPDFKQINFSDHFGVGDLCPDHTIAKFGCGPTSLAMVVRHFGFDVDPSSMAKEWMKTDNWGKNSCWVVGTGGMFADQTFLNKYNLNTENLGSNKEKIIDALKNGKPVIASMGPGTDTDPSRWTKSGHFIVLVKINNDGTIFVRDPGRRSLCVRKINKCPGEDQSSLTTVNPDWLFPYIRTSTTFWKK